MDVQIEEWLKQNSIAEINAILDENNFDIINLRRRLQYHNPSIMGDIVEARIKNTKSVRDIYIECNFTSEICEKFSYLKNVHWGVLIKTNTQIKNFKKTGEIDFQINLNEQTKKSILIDKIEIDKIIMWKKLSELN